MEENFSGPAIQAESIHKSYGNLQAVQALNFQVEPGICYGMLGPNGAGKTTMMKIIYGKCLRDHHQESRLRVFGHDPASDPLAIRALAGVVPQENNLDEELNVEQNLVIYAGLYGISRRAARKRIAELLEFMEIADKCKSKIKALSGGMKRRLTIARALLNRPRLLILDEPTTGLDPQVRHHIWDRLRKLRGQGVTILLTTHYMEEAFQIADRILIMDHGKKIMEGRPDSLLSDNIEGYVLELKDQSLLKSLENELSGKAVRIDHTEQLALLYADDADLLQALSRRVPAGSGYLRQANLEDLFLKITGRGLKDAQ